MFTIKTHEGVYDIFRMDSEISGYVESKEAAIKSQGYVVVNEAINQMRPKSNKYCVFSRGFLEPATDQLVVLMDIECGLCGHDVPPEMKDQVPEDAMWISDTFVMYPDKISGGEVKMILNPYSLNFLNAIDGVSGAIAYNPSLETNEFLRRKYDFHGPAAATSTIVALDYSDPGVCAQR